MGSGAAAYLDLLDQPESLRGFLAGSLALHVSIAAAIVAVSWIGPGRREQWGDLNGGGMGSVAVGLVKTVPMPGRSGQMNPVANDTESAVPTPPPKTKPQAKAKEPEPDAIPIRSRNAAKRPQQAASAPNKWREQQKDLPNQLYSPSGQAVVSPMYGMAGGGGVGIGSNSPFGTQLGWYATLLRDQVARNWRTSDMDPRLQSAPPVIVAFGIRRDGSVVPGSVRVVQRSGNAAVDISAQRAVLDAAPFPVIPPQFPRDQADIEMTFQLRR
jgi:periplasmic protein TonB